MPLSQNLVFIRPICPDDLSEDPPGYSIAERLKNGLSERDWNVSDIDIWRDCGWNIVCADVDARMALVIAATSRSSEWYLQIAPEKAPGILGRLLGKTTSADGHDLLHLARDVHEILCEDGSTGFRWRWNGPPEERNSTAEPTEEESIRRRRKAMSPSQFRKRVPAVVFASLLPGEIRVNLLLGGPPLDLPYQEIPPDLRMPNSRLWIRLDKDWKVVRVWRREPDE